MIDIRVTQLRDVIQKGKSLLIFTHDYPDPDAMVAAEILRVLAGYWGVSSKITYGGQIDRPENASMMETLGFRLQHLSTVTVGDYAAIALVDSQENFPNHSIPSGYVPRIVFDHHRGSSSSAESLDISQEDPEQFFHLDEKVSAVCTLLMEYLLQVNPSLITKELATGVCYAICTETMDFARNYSNRDEELYREMCLHCDPILLSKIRSAPIDLDFYRSLEVFIKNLQEQDGILTTYCSKVVFPYHVPYVADLLSRTKGCRYVFVAAGEQEFGKIRISARSSVHGENLLHLGDTIKQTLQGIGTGGGHLDVAAGVFDGDEKLLKEIFTKLRAAVRE